MVKDTITLFERSWVPSGKLRGRVVIVHGLGEHSGRYAHLAEALAGAALSTHSFDLRGHGLSGGRRVYINSFVEYVSDLARFIERLRQSGTGMPLFLMGHSMGGAIAAMYSISHQDALSGLILSSAALRIHDDFSPFLQALSRIIAAVVPRLPTLKIDSALISRDPETIRQYDNDPLIYHGGTKARTGAEIVKVTRTLQEKAHLLRLPLLIFHGTADRITDPRGSDMIYQRAAAADKKLYLYEGLYHETLNEPEKAIVIQNIITWLEGRY